jgi:hypothetical protein
VGLVVAVRVERQVEITPEHLELQTQAAAVVVGHINLRIHQQAVTAVQA